MCIVAVVDPACKSHLICPALYRHVWSVWLYHIFPHHLINGTVFGGGGGILNIKCILLIFSTNLSETFLVLRRKHRDIIVNIHWYSCKLPVILVRFQWHLNFLDRFWKDPQVQNLMNFRPVGTDLFHADRKKRVDGRTDRRTRQNP